MTETSNKPFVHPASVVFSFMEDREFRLSVVRPGVTKDKAAVCRLSTGKHQLKGFRHLEKAPDVMVAPVLADEAVISAELARALLAAWLEVNGDLRDRVAARLAELGYAAQDQPFDEDDNAMWRSLTDEHARLQYDGVFLEGEEKNAAMLMSLLLGWFGSDKDDETGDTEPDDETGDTEPDDETGDTVPAGDDAPSA
jgi:hypothetical protein